MKPILMLAVLALVVGGQGANQAEVQLQAAIKAEVFDGNLKTAIERYQRIVTTYPSDRPVVAKALVRMGQCYEKLGETQTSEARKAYERVVREFADQKEAVDQARVLLAASSRDRREATGVSEQQVWVLDENPRPVPRQPSLDGRYIPYTDLAGQRVKLHDLATGENRVIVEKESGFFFGAPGISPDGRQIAYTRFRRPPLAGADFELRIANIDGSGVTVLASDKEDGAAALAWSPDGRHILARIGNSSADVSLQFVPVAGGSARVLTTGGEDSNGCLSPDGKYIVTYPVGTRAGRSPGGFKLRSADGGPALSLFDSPARNWAPFWATDGRHILFLSDRTGTTALWSVRMNGTRAAGEPDLIRSNAESMNPLGFTRDGSFYFQRLRPYQQDVYVADFDPETARAVSEPARINQRAVGKSGLGVAWSPDGQFVAYTRESAGSTIGVVLRADKTGEEREIVPASPFPPGASVVSLDWFPDGRALLTQVQDGNGHSRLLRVDAQTGEAKVVLDRDATGESVRNSALGRAVKTIVYVQSADPKRKEERTAFLMRRDLDTGETRELHRSERYVESPSLSPDGRQVLFQGSYPGLNTMSLLIMPAEGGPIRELYRSKEWMSANIWTSDGRRVLFSPVSKSDRQPVLSIPIEGGEPQPTGLSLPIVYSMALRPDGRRIALVSGEGGTDEVWVVRNLLPAAQPPRR
jgi:Tol biopolymer transport system component